MKIRELGKKVTQAVKNTLGSILNAIIWTVKKIYNIIYWFVREIVTATIHISLIVMLALLIPKIHDSYIRRNTAKHVYMVTDRKERGGGTGFAVTAPSGKSYILTNAHICKMENRRKVLKVRQAGMNRFVPKRIIERSRRTDLCLIEGFPNSGGLQLADNVRLRESITFVGHPLLNPIVVRQGEILARQSIDIVDDLSRARCRPPRYKMKKIDMNRGPKRRMCVESVDSYITDVEVYGGSSGSAAVDKFGQVVGIVFATDTRSNWGAIIPLDHIKSFLAPY